MKNNTNLSRSICKYRGWGNQWLKLGVLSCSLLSTMPTLASTNSSLIADEVVTVMQQDISFKALLDRFEKEKGYTIVLNAAELNLNRLVKQPLSLDNPKEVLSETLKESDVDFEIKDNYIILFKRESGPKLDQHTIHNYSGTIYDNEGLPVIGATIIVKGTTQGIISDIDGNFSLNAPLGSTLQISYVGYKNRNIKLNDRVKLGKIILEEDSGLLDEVVVIGYGVQKKRDLTGAVSSVKLSDEPIATVSSVSSVLAGKAAGLQVNTVSAQPGGGAAITVRGAGSINASNSPLIVIDGFPVNEPQKVSAGRYDSGSSENVLSSLNPNDIESIEVLKDASSTAIYGSRAANGVILITTKKGKEGKPSVSYSGSVSAQVIAKRYDMLDAKDFMIESNRYARENFLYKNKIAPYGDKLESDIQQVYKPRYTDGQILNPEYDTDWFDEISRTGFQTQHNVSISGGSENTKYMTSINYFGQNGIVKTNKFDRYTGRVNLEHTINTKVKIGTNLTFSRNDVRNVPLGAGQNEYAGILVSAAQFNPLLPIRDKDGKYSLNTEAAFLPNPVSLLDIDDRSRKERFLGTAFIEYKPIKDLTLQGKVGIDRNYNKRKSYLPTTTLYGQKTGGQADIAQFERTDYLAELTASYSKVIKDHSFTGLLGYSYEKNELENFSAGNQQFLTDGFLTNNLGAGAAPKPWVGSGASSDEMLSLFARFIYSYKGKYLMTATFRGDAASNFSKGNRWGYFPSVSLGWRFSDEDFMKSINKALSLSNGKLRVSYGETGNSRVGYRVVSTYGVANNNEFGDVESQGVILNQIGNENLTWETTKEWNIGLELGFFNNRLNLTAEYYNRRIVDLLSSRPLQSYQEIGSIMDNIGETQSKGFELTVNSQNITTKDWDWSTDLTFSFYRDRWKKRSPFWKPAVYQRTNDYIRSSFGYLSDGIIQPGENVPHMPGAIPGQVKIKDLDGFKRNSDGSFAVDENGRFIKTGQPDGIIDEADIVPYGKNDPGYLVGFNNTVRWKNFDLNIYFYGLFDNPKYGSYQDLWLTGTNNMTGIINMYRGYNMPNTAKSVWTHDNPSADRPGYFQDKSSYGIGDFYKQNAWFIRCRNITLGYSFDALPKIFSKLRIYADVNNPFVITKYKGLDPETDNSAWAYPNVRSFSLGVDITF